MNFMGSIPGCYGLSLPHSFGNIILPSKLALMAPSPARHHNRRSCWCQVQYKYFTSLPFMLQSHLMSVLCIYVMYHIQYNIHIFADIYLSSGSLLTSNYSPSLKWISYFLLIWFSLHGYLVLMLTRTSSVLPFIHLPHPALQSLLLAP